MPSVPPVVGGLLGADFEIDNGRYKVARIYDNESWNPDLRSPLATPGANVSVGEYILAINGVELKAPDNIHRLLDGTANRQTALTVNSTPSMQGARTVTVIPIASEQALRTRAWVESNRRLVEKLSDGQLAYVYLPNTGQPGYSSFNRYYFSNKIRKAPSSMNVLMAAAQRLTTSSMFFSETMTATSTTLRAIVIPSLVHRRASGDQR
jgi:tricorn protease